MLQKELLEAYCLVFIVLLQLSQCHWQCQSSFPPVKADPPHVFCTMHNEHSCCSQEDDLHLLAKFKLYSKYIELDKCAKQLTNLLCMKCSVLSAHAFDGNFPVGLPVNFPNLCFDYCIELLQTCSSSYNFLLHSQSNGSILQTCTKLSYGSVEDCYPHINKQHEAVDKDLEVVEPSGNGAYSKCVCAEEFASNLHNPLLARPAFDGTGRIFVLEQRGLIKIFYENGDSEPNPFIDMNKLEDFLPAQHRFDERGLLGIAFHPRFKTNGKVYIHYSCVSRSAHSIKQGMCVAISEMLLDSRDSNKLNASTVRVLLHIYEPFANHNGGEMFFDEHGYLLLFVGDGGSQKDPLGNGQKTDTFLGKVLRIDVDSRSREKPYGIPDDNPFVGNASFLPEIYAYGVRNIWRCGKDRGHRQTGSGKNRVLCGDVGQDQWETIDLLVKGVNYGWSAFEGTHCYKPELCNSVGPVEMPVYEYNHSVGKSVTGGVFYRGCKSSQLDGVYVYGDFDSGQLFGLIDEGDENVSKWRNFDLPMCTHCPDGTLNHMQRFILSFGEDEKGEVYALTSNRVDAAQPTGKIYRLFDPASDSNC